MNIIHMQVRAYVVTRAILAAVGLGALIYAAAPAHADIGLVLGETGISTPSAEDVAAAQQLYLDPNGFNGTATAFTTPEGDSDAGYLTGESDLASALEADYNAGEISAADPAYVFGYSQSAIISGAVEQQLSDYGIPEPDLHFVLVGDTASAFGGMTNSFPWIFQDFGYPHEAGLVTPDQFYTTDVYTIPDDNWADSVNAALFGTIPSLSSPQHLEYEGVSLTDVHDATLAHVQGLTDYFTLEPANQLTALFDALLESMNIPVG
jgi:hypothetical protein